MHKKFSILVVCLFLTSVVYANIVQTSNINVILKEIQQDNKDTVVLLDIGDVLLTADDKILSNSIPEAKELFKKFEQELHTRYSKEKVNELLSIILLNRKAHLVDPGFINLVHEANKHTKGVLCVTTSGVGRFGKMKSWEEWRINELKNLGLTFTSPTFPDVSAQELTKYLNKADAHCNPVCKNGILFVCNVAKANTVQAYFKVIGLKPKKIVFVDDDRKLVEQIAEYCSAEKIEYVGFEYIAVKDQAKNAEFNPKVAELQLKTLEKDEVWLSDAEAASILAASESPHLAGAYSTINPYDPAAQDAAEFAAQQLKGTLTKVLAAKSQVVAGMNYDLTLELTGSDGAAYIYNVIVFVPLPVEQKPMQLIRWNEIENQKN